MSTSGLEFILPVALAIPIIGALLLILIPSKRESEITTVSLFISLVDFFVLCIAAVYKHAQFEDISSSFEWISTRVVNINFSLDLVDGLSTTLVLLTGLLTPLCVLVSKKAIKEKRVMFNACLLILQAGMLGTFMATDLFTFYICWESVLIPMLLLIGIWGSANRRYAALKLFLYTMLGSLPMLAALLSISWNGQQFVTALNQLEVQSETTSWAFWCMAFAFAIKLPLIPLHTWLPDAHTEAPTAGSVILAGVMLKMGTYGFLRLAYPLFGMVAVEAFEILGWIACIGIVWGSLMALAQTDIKRLIAYSSVAHLGTCMLGIFALNPIAFVGGELQMINHGISTGLLFLVFGMLYDRGHVRDIAAYGGLARKMPLLATAFFIATMASVGLPLTNGFIGEFMVLLGAFEANKAWGIVAASGVVLGAVYMLRLFRLVFLGSYKVPEGTEDSMRDLSEREVIILLPLILLVLIIGIAPGLVTDLLPEAADLIIEPRTSVWGGF